MILNQSLSTPTISELFASRVLAFAPSSRAERGCEGLPRDLFASSLNHAKKADKREKKGRPMTASPSQYRNVIGNLPGQCTPHVLVYLSITVILSPFAP